MAFTPQELSIAKQVKEQGGSRQDFIDVLQQIRGQSTAVVEEKVEAIETPEGVAVQEQVSTVETKEDFLTPEAIGEIGERSQAKIETEQKAEELLGEGFISETGEALANRGVKTKEVFNRLQDKINTNAENIRTTIKQEGAGSGFIEAMKGSLNNLGSAVQTVGQGFGAAGDVIFEGLENAVQIGLPKESEVAIAESFKELGEGETAQGLAQAYKGFRERNPEGARNIEAVFNIGQFVPLGAAGKFVTKPFTKAGQQATKKAAEQGVKDLSRGLLNIPGKLNPTKELSLGKFFAGKVKPTQSFDDVAEQFAKIGDDAINKVNSSLKSSTSIHKPQGAKEVLNAIKENLKNIPFATNQKKTVNDLLKKFSTTGLTLADLNKIKRSINEYTRAWTAAGKDAAGLAPDAMRGKYSEIKTFIENIAKKEGLPDIKALNQDWIQSNELFELLSKQATSIGKKKGVQSLQKTGILRNLGTKIRQLREDLGFSDLPGAQGLEDIDLVKALETLIKANKSTEKTSILEVLGKGK